MTIHPPGRYFVIEFRGDPSWMPSRDELELALMRQWAAATRVVAEIAPEIYHGSALEKKVAMQKIGEQP